MSRKAVGLFSGGLDSAVAIAVVKEQGVEVVGFHCLSQFGPVDDHGGPTAPVLALAEETGVPLHCHDFTDEQLALVRNPQFGLGKNLNPCMDCHLAMLKHAEAYRQEIGADFIVSGEVAGQRPMSQKMESLRRINTASGFEDMILRPLSAHLFPETLAEREGWVDRTRFPQIEGRERHIQFALAEKFNLKSYGYPAGGCMLTIAYFCTKLRDLMERQEVVTPHDIALLKVGRMLRVSGDHRAFVGRDDAENRRLIQLARPEDWILQTVSPPGAMALVPAGADEAVLRVVAGVVGHYSRNRDVGIADVCLWRGAQVPREGGIVWPAVPVFDPENLILV